MSFEGFRGNSSGNNISDNSGGIKGQQRDAWNQPIKEPENNAGNKNANGSGNDTSNNQNGNVNNNTSINTDTIDDIWSDIKKPNSQDDQNRNNQGNNNNGGGNQPQQLDPATQLKKYLTDNGLGEFTLTDAEKAQLGEGNYDGLQGRILGLVQQAHVKAISSASALIDSKIAAALKQGENATKSLLAGKENMGALHSALPFTKDPAIGPVAQTVMQRFFDRGATQEQAIQGVKKFFEHTAQKVTGNEVNQNRNGNFGSRPKNENDGVGNWIDILSPKG